MSERPPRLTFDELFDLLAVFYSCRGTCDRLRTATVLRDTNNILIGAGYNGALAGDPHCDDERVGHFMVENHCHRTNHGEENAIFNCFELARIKDGTATIIGSPCFDCARRLLTHKIKRLRYIGTYSNPLGGNAVETFCRQHGVIVEYVEPADVLLALQKALDFLQGPGGLFKNLPKLTIELEERNK